MQYSKEIFIFIINLLQCSEFQALPVMFLKNRPAGDATG
jgi:hypothetical protein